jgi:hypothetical protein
LWLKGAGRNDNRSRTAMPSLAMQRQMPSPLNNRTSIAVSVPQTIAAIG